MDEEQIITLFFARSEQAIEAPVPWWGTHLR